jgi:AcrR family transcriptional regulator
MPVDSDIDPRVKRTRQMLFQALEELLHEKGFDAITMQHLADRSTLNRGTIYAHFKDKYALLAAHVEEKFRQLFEARMRGASSACQESVRQLILTVCDFLGPMMACSQEHQRPFEPIVESTVRTIVRNFLLEGLRQSKRVTSCADAELRATAGSWAICGTIVEWSRTRSTSAEELAKAVLPLVSAGVLLLDPAPAEKAPRETGARRSTGPGKTSARAG